MIHQDADDRRVVRVGQSVSMLALANAGLLCPVVPNFGGIFRYFQTGVTILATPFISVFLLGILWRRANYPGALCGMVGGLVIQFAVAFGAPILGVKLHWLYAGSIAQVIIMVGVVAVSSATAPPNRELVESFVWRPSLLAGHTQPHVLEAVIEATGDGSGLFDGIGNLTIGEDPFAVDRLCDKLFTGSIYYGRRGVVLKAVSGIDIACHDIMGKALNLAVHALLGGARRQRVPAYASTLFRDTPEGMRAAAKRYLEPGFTAVKFGWGGFGGDLPRDVKLVHSARETLGEKPVLMIDAGWIHPRSIKETIALGHSRGGEAFPTEAAHAMCNFLDHCGSLRGFVYPRSGE